MRKGSTILEIEAPVLSESIGDIQLPIFYDFDSEDLNKKSALDLTFHAYNHAVSQMDSQLLDKNLLKEFAKLNKIIDSDVTELIFESGNEAYLVNRTELSEIEILEQKAPASLKTQVKGKLDLLSHSKSQLELITGGKRIRAQLSSTISFDDLFQYFGKDVVITGYAHFTPDGTVKSLEIDKIRMSTQNDSYFDRIPTPIFPEFQLEEEQSKYQYNSTKLDNIFGKWPGDESTEDILSLLSK